MSHPDEDQLLDLALSRDARAGGGQALPEEIVRHVAGCDACTAELAALRRVLAAGREGAPEIPTSVPGVRVWQGVRREIDQHAGPTDPMVDALVGRADPADRPLERPHRHRTAVLAVAASLVVGLAGGAAIATGLGGDDTPPVTAEQIATAALEPLTGSGGTGSAEVHGTDQDRRLTVSLDGGQPGAGDGGYLEVWLLDETAQRLVPLGALTAGRGEFTVPAGVDLADYPVVDVSVEPVDGDPAHSGDSVARGRLDV